ncbi:MAG: cryptochrome/photolyase family protein, partial [Burkholderiales bacterium]
YSFSLRTTIPAGTHGARARLEKFLSLIDDYAITRDYPAWDITSHLGVDLRFGTVSIRKLVMLALSRLSNGAEVWLTELIWREFFSQILYHFPHVVTQPFRLEYEALEYGNNKEWFSRWCNGETGYPIVDAGMRQLNLTGFMHNRVRMICASFLTKDLLIDWRWGERYFANQLLDYEMASNNGNWQWCAGTGCDAQPYFRIFNPILQSQRFDSEGRYIKQYVPELTLLDSTAIHAPFNAKILPIKLDLDYPLPIVAHAKQVILAKQMFVRLKNKLI